MIKVNPEPPLPKRRVFLKVIVRGLNHVKMSSRRQHESGAEKRKKKKLRDDARASIAGDSVFYRFNCFANIANRS